MNESVLNATCSISESQQSKEGLGSWKQNWRDQGSYQTLSSVADGEEEKYANKNL